MEHRVTIENRGMENVPLLSRFWRITDARVLEMRSSGVIGEQPVIAPGRSYEYTSGAPLETPSGFMTSTYRMRSDTGESFDIGIPMFALDGPYEVRRGY